MHPVKIKEKETILIDSKNNKIIDLVLKPIINAGIVPINKNNIYFFVKGLLRSHESCIISFLKTTITLNNVPRWVTTSIILPGSLSPNKDWAITKWPELLIGRN